MSQHTHFELVLDGFSPADDLTRLRSVLDGYDRLQTRVQACRDVIAGLDAQRFPGTPEGSLAEIQRDHRVDQLRRQLRDAQQLRSGYALCLRRAYGPEGIEALRRAIALCDREEADETDETETIRLEMPTC